MEGLHAIIEKAKSVRLFSGAEVGANRLLLSHLMYADDVIFMGDWSLHNASNFISVLRCFYVMSGLKINVRKSKLIGIGVEEVESRQMASVLGCRVEKTPFSYLGVPVGSNMSRIESWRDVVEKFKSKLTNWRACTLSVGGRLTLIKSVLSNLPTYYLSIYKMPVAVEKKLEALRNNFFIGGDLEERKMTWVAWRRCMASKEYGGLSIGSIFALNRALLFKWIWRFRNNQNELWSSVISSIYGPNGGIGRSTRGSFASPWCAVIKAATQLCNRNVDLFAGCQRKVGDGRSISFWHDVWLGGISLSNRYNRVYALDRDKDCRVVERISLADWSGCLRRHPRGGVEEHQFMGLQEELASVALTGGSDAWVWESDPEGGFSVKSARTMIDASILDVDDIATRWNRWVPAKVNVFA